MAPAAELVFIASDPRFEVATQEYREIWNEHGTRIRNALMRTTGKTLPDATVTVIIHEGISQSGARGKSMRMRASYDEPVKRATLVHELLHRHLDEIPGVARCHPEIHDLMSILLLGVWSELWGTDFANAQARVESTRSERYRKSWSRALAMTPEQRQAASASMTQCDALRADP